MLLSFKLPNHFRNVSKQKQIIKKPLSSVYWATNEGM